MAYNDNSVDIGVNIVQTGQDTIGKVETAMSNLNTSLQKQVPALKDVTPLLGSFGLGWVTAAGALAAFTTIGTQTNQIFETMLRSSTNYTVAINTTTRGIENNNKALADAQELSDKYSIKINDIQKAFPKFTAVTRDYTTAHSMMNDALKISHDRGIGLEDVVTSLADAYSKAGTVIDKTGAVVPVGPMAYRTRLEQLQKSGGGYAGYDYRMNQASSKEFQESTAPVGGFFNQIWHDIQFLLANLNPAGIWSNKPSPVMQEWEREHPWYRGMGGVGGEAGTLHIQMQVDGKVLSDTVINNLNDTTNLKGGR